MRKGKKSQAAMEFLLNYGWIILIVLIIIGALFYFGVLNPKSLIPEKCIFKAGFECLDYSVSRYDSGAGGVVTLKLLNTMGQGVTIKSLNLFSTGITLECSNPSNAVLYPAKADYILFACTGTFPPKDKVKFEITGDYYIADPSFTKEIYGELTATIMTVPAPSAGLELTMPEGQFAVINEPVQYKIKIKNTGTGLDTYKISIGANPLVTIAAPAGGEGTITIPAGGEDTYDISLSFSEEREYTTHIKAESTVNSSKTAEGDVTTTVTTAPVYDFKMSINPEPPVIVVESGGSAVYDVTVKNRGFGGSFSLSADPDDKAAFDNPSFDLLSGETRTAKMTVTPSHSDTLVESSLTGSLHGTTHSIDDIKTIIACNGFVMNDLSATTVEFFSGRIVFSGPIATKEAPSYPPDVMPTSYKITVTGIAGTDIIEVPATGINNAIFNIAKTGKVSRIDIVPVVMVESEGVDCSNKRATVNNPETIDSEGREIEQIWKVWDDDVVQPGASLDTQKVYSGSSSLRYKYPDAWDKPINIASGTISLQDADYFTFAISGYNDDPASPGNYVFLFFQGYTYDIGTYPCALPGVYGGWGILGGPLPGPIWSLVNIDLDTPKAYPCIDLRDRPTASINSLTVRIPYPGSTIYFDTMYFYSVK